MHFLKNEINNQFDERTLKISVMSYGSFCQNII